VTGGGVVRREKEYSAHGKGECETRKYDNVPKVKQSMKIVKKSRKGAKKDGAKGGGVKEEIQK